MNINVQDIILKAHKRIDKKYMDDPSYLLRKRVLNTAASVLDKIDDITFEDLASDNFFICKEVGFKYFSDKYRAALEFAKVQPEKLPDELYKLFRDTGKEVKKSGRLEEFFLFLSLFEENTAVSEKYRNVYLAYLDLLIEQTEFLKPNVYDKNHIVAGLTTDGEVLLTNDLFPDIDLPVYEFARASTKTKDVLEKIFNKYGLKDEDEYRFCSSASTIYQNNILLLVPYINEYTFDMLPVYMYSPNITTPLIKPKDIDFTERLKNRHRTLPTNGAVVYFQDSIYLKTAILKEIFYNNTIHMLCKLETVVGDVTVRYNTKTGVFFSPFNHMGGVQCDPS